MKRVVFGAVVTAVLVWQAATFTQAPKPPVIATDIPAAEVKAVLDAPSAIADRHAGASVRAGSGSEPWPRTTSRMITATWGSRAC